MRRRGTGFLYRVRLEDWQWRAEDEGRRVYLVEVVREWIGRLVGGTGLILRCMKRGLLLLEVFFVLLRLRLQKVRELGGLRRVCLLWDRRLAISLSSCTPTGSSRMEEESVDVIVTDG